MSTEQTRQGNQWWGYRHAEGGMILKRYFGPRDIEEATESDFVLDIVGPFYASNIEEARAILPTYFERR